MRLFSKAPVPPIAEPQMSAPPIVIRPLRPAVPARTYEQRLPGRIDRGRASLVPSAAQLVRDPQAYPAAPPRIEGAVKRTYVMEPES